MPENHDKILIILISVGLGGTERRIGDLFKFLSDKTPDKYHLIINRELYNTLQKANYQLENYSNIHVLDNRSLLDFKVGPNSTKIVQLGRVLTLFKYRREIKKVIRKEKIITIQAFLEMVPFLGIFPIRHVKSIASLVSHLPQYYDQDNINCRLLIQALLGFDKIDALYQFIADNLIKLRVAEKKIYFPKRNFVNHILFRPEKKEKIVTFTSRMLTFKNPQILLQAIMEALPFVDDEFSFYIMGKGPLFEAIQKEIKRKKLDMRIMTGFLFDPSEIVNKSQIHISIEEYDNATNQSLLEGMAAGCAIITNKAGLTSDVVTTDFAVCVNMTVNEISKTLISLLNNPDLVKEMGFKSREKILEDHTIEEYLDYITRLYVFD